MVWEPVGGKGKQSVRFIKAVSSRQGVGNAHNAFPKVRKFLVCVVPSFKSARPYSLSFGKPCELHWDTGISWHSQTGSQKERLGGRIPPQAAHCHAGTNGSMWRFGESLDNLVKNQKRFIR